MGRVTARLAPAALPTPRSPNRLAPLTSMGSAPPRSSPSPRAGVRPRRARPTWAALGSLATPGWALRPSWAAARG
eukprot:7666860-Lingulodinium_polyedra.AAC.1